MCERAVIHVAVSDVADRDAEYVAQDEKSGFRLNRAMPHLRETATDHVQLVEHDLMLTAVLRELRIADAGKLLLVESEMRFEHLVELFGEGLHLVEVTVLVPEIRDFKRYVEDRLMLGVDLRPDPLYANS